VLGNNIRASILCRGVVTETIPSEPHKSMKLNINRQKSLIIFNVQPFVRHCRQNPMCRGPKQDRVHPTTTWQQYQGTF
jgi:hypothetical protein